MAIRTRSKLLLLLCLAFLAGAAFACGTLVGKYLLPHVFDSSAANQPFFFAEFRKTRPDAARNRIQFLSGASLGGPVLWFGGPFQFLEHCPKWGCLAVEYAADGELLHAYPYRPRELEQAWAAGLAGDEAHLWGADESFIRVFNPFGMQLYANGDLQVIFLRTTSIPHYGGIARIDRDGRPIWFRRDHSHHWADVEADGTAMVPAAILGKPVSPKFKEMKPAPVECTVDTLRRPSINFLDEDGSLLRETDFLEVLLESPYAHILPHMSILVSNPPPGASCNFVHLNFARRLRDDAGGTWGIAPGDIVASMRNLSAFAILDGQARRVKRIVRGSFFRQHSVHHLEGSKFLLFDNLGSDGAHGPSRVLVVDLADGSETTLFPNDRTPEHLRGLYTRIAGHITISPDRSRAIATFSWPGIAVEISLADGEALNTFRSLHDVSSVEDFPEERIDRAAAFRMTGMEYIHRRLETP